MYRFEPLVPLIGATVAGPLGVSHLPRMWLKSNLHAAGILPEAYFHDYKGFNKIVVDKLGLEPQAWFAFLATMPDYPSAEAYVREHAEHLDAATIAELNAHIATFERAEENAAQVRATVGLADPTFRVSAMLLNLDDWYAIHKAIVEHRNEAFEPLVPMISSGQTGPAGIPHLPRLWFKALLNAVHALPEGWKTGLICGFDTNASKTIGLDLAATVAYIESELPNYLQFEAWVLGRIGTPDDATKAGWVSKLTSGQKGEEQARNECIEAGVPGQPYRGTILLNDLVDWKHMHDALVARHVARA